MNPSSIWELPLKNLASWPRTEDRSDPGRVREGILRSMGKTPTDKSSSFFLQANVDYLNDTLISTFYRESGFVIDRQNDVDILAIMRKAYIDNSSRSIGFLNSLVLETMLKQVRTGVSAHVNYVMSLDKPLNVFDPPANTSTSGLRVDEGRKKIGM